MSVDGPSIAAGVALWIEEPESVEFGHDSFDLVGELLDICAHSPTHAFDEPVRAFAVEFGPYDDRPAGQHVTRGLDRVVHYEVAVEFDDGQIVP